jgi:CheY-like chemotaxis protein
MNGVLGMTALLFETPLTAEQRGLADIIRVSGENLLSVINDILDFSKIESGQMELDTHDFGLRRCIEDVFDLFSETAAKKHLELLYRIDFALPDRLFGDQTRMRQILINLINNAIKFTPAGSVYMEISLREKHLDNLNVGFVIKDTGIGIAKDKLPRLFKAFSQGDASTTRKHGGSGLGLVICERLVELMGGSIAIESEQGKGTSVTFNVKCKLSDAAENQVMGFSATEAEGKRVLLIDNNLTVLGLLEEQLRFWNLNAVCTSTVYNALKLLTAGEKFQLVIVSSTIPIAEIAELNKMAKKTNPGIRVVLVCAVIDQQKNWGLVDKILTKPVKQRELYQIVRDELLNNRQSVSGQAQATSLSEQFAFRFPMKILIAEDNPINQKLIGKVITKLGYESVIVTNGNQVLETLDTAHFDTILMDVQMPELDGLETTRIIRRRGIRQPYIIALTAGAMLEDKSECLAAGMNYFMTKPINIPELKVALEKAFLEKEVN